MACWFQELGELPLDGVYTALEGAGALTGRTLDINLSLEAQVSSMAQSAFVQLQLMQQIQPKDSLATVITVAV